MTYGAALAAVACFAFAIHRLDIVSVARRALQSGFDATRVMRSVQDDDEKERAVQAASLVLLRCFGSIAVRSAAAVGVSLLPLLALDLAGVVPISDVNALLVSWNGIVLASVAFGVVYLFRARQ